MLIGEKTPQHRFFLPKINLRSGINIVLLNSSKWTLAIMGGCCIWLILSLYSSLSFEVSYPGETGFLLPGLANVLNCLATEEGIKNNFSLFIWAVEILFGVFFSIYAGLMLFLLAEPSGDLEMRIKTTVDVIFLAMMILLINFAGTQLL